MRVTIDVIAGPNHGQRIELPEEGELSIGRGLEADHRINDPFMSRVHVHVSVLDERVMLRDAESKTGTRVNGELVDECQLQIGDVILAGATPLRLQLCEASKPGEVPSDASDSVSYWLAQLPHANEEAYEHLWNAFFPRLVSLARSHLNSAHRRAVDEEDIALGAMDSFFRGVKGGRFQLADRDETWRLLVAITARKVIDLRRREMAKKRGGGKVLGESALGDVEAIAGIEQILDHRSVGDLTKPLSIAVEELMNQLGSDVLRETASLKLQGFSNLEISERMHCSPSTTKSRLREVRSIWSKAD